MRVFYLYTYLPVWGTLKVRLPLYAGIAVSEGLWVVGVLAMDGASSSNAACGGLSG